LFAPQDEIAIGDKIEVAGIEISVASVMPRFAMSGKLDHWQVDGNIWAYV
jgi:hypothetical protein